MPVFVLYEQVLQIDMLIIQYQCVTWRGSSLAINHKQLNNRYPLCTSSIYGLYPFDDSIEEAFCRPHIHTVVEVVAGCADHSRLSGWSYYSEMVWCLQRIVCRSAAGSRKSEHNLYTSRNDSNQRREHPQTAQHFAFGTQNLVTTFWDVQQYFECTYVYALLH